MVQVFSFLFGLAAALGVSLKLVSFAMLAIAAGLLWATIWFWRTARPETEVLAPLEIMGEREFLDADEDGRKRMLNTVRAKPNLGATSENESPPAKPNLDATKTN